MTDDSRNPSKNQSPVSSRPTPQTPQVLYETVEEGTPLKAKNLVPEEVTSTATNPAQAAPNVRKPMPPPVKPPVTPPAPPTQKAARKYLMIAAGGVGLIVLFILVFWGIFSRFASKKPVHLVYWGLWEDSSVMEPIIKSYEAQNKNITIEYQRLTPDSYREKLLARSKAGRGPDIFRFHNTWLPEIRDVATPIPASIMTAAEYEKTFYPVTKKDLKVDKFYYGIPLMIDGLVLVYNDDLLKKAGIDAAPVSWEDIINDASRLTVKEKEGTIITSGIALGTSTNVDHFSDILGLFLTQNGASLDKLDAPEAAGALESYRKFAETPDNVWDESLPPSTIAFAQEKVAMIIVPSWEIMTIKNLNPQIKMKVTAVPVLPGNPAVTLASYWVEGVSKYSQNQEEAWKFVKFLSEKKTMTQMYELEAKTRAFGEPYSRVDLADTLADNELIGAVIRQAPSMVSMPVVSSTFDNGLNDEIIAYLGNAVTAAAEGTSYSDALIPAKQGIDQVFQKYQIQLAK